MESTQTTIEPKYTLVSDDRRYILVSIGNDTFGIPIKSVREVIEYTKITMVPMCSDILQGVINVRGSVVPVINAAKRLSISSAKKYDRYSCVVIYEIRPENFEEVITLGVLVNRVCSIESVAHEYLASPPYFGSNIPKQFIWHMSEIGGELCALLDMDSFLNVRDINQAIKSSQAQFFLNYSR